MDWLEDTLGYEGSDCKFWPFTKSREGYARVWHNKRMYPAHRLMCELANGQAPQASMDTAHSCGNGHLGCMTKSHLRWATKAENCQDRILHGTDTAGERNSQAKLDAQTVAIIREVAQFATHRTLARYYGISETQIHRIVKNQRWSSI